MIKIIAEDGTEYQPKTREEATALVRQLVPDARHGRKAGHHVERLSSGHYRYKYVERGVASFGPSRATWDEAAADYQRLLAGDPLAPTAVGKGSEEHRRKCRESHRRWYEAAKAAAPDGKVHVGPATCSGCKHLGHKVTYCPARGWTPKVATPKAPREPKTRALRTRSEPRGCAFCGGAGHRAARCDQRKQALAERLRARAA